MENSSINQRTLLLLERLNGNITNLSRRFDSIIQLSSLNNNNTNTNNNNNNTTSNTTIDHHDHPNTSTTSKDKHLTASETFQIEVHAAGMIRAAEDLLALSRSLKEAWLFGSFFQEKVGEGREEREGVLLGDARVVGVGLDGWYKGLGIGELGDRDEEEGGGGGDKSGMEDWGGSGGGSGKGKEPLWK